MSSPSVNAMTNYYGASTFGASVAPRSRSLDSFEIRAVEAARAKPRPDGWQKIAHDLNRNEHDVRTCCDPTYQREPAPAPEIDPAILEFRVPQTPIALMSKEVAETYGHTFEALMRGDKKKGIATARQECMWRASRMKTKTGARMYSDSAIGRFYGKDHSTVGFGIQAHQDRLDGTPPRRRKGAKATLLPIKDDAPIIASVLSAPTPADQLAQRRAYR